MEYRTVQMRKVGGMYNERTGAVAEHDTEQSAARWFIAEYASKPQNCSMALERTDDRQRWSYNECEALA